MPTPTGPPPPDNPATPSLYIFLYRNRKRNKRPATHSKAVKKS